MHQIDLYIETIARIIDWIAIAILGQRNYVY